MEKSLRILKYAGSLVGHLSRKGSTAGNWQISCCWPAAATGTAATRTARTFIPLRIIERSPLGLARHATSGPERWSLDLDDQLFTRNGTLATPRSSPDCASL